MRVIFLFLLLQTSHAFAQTHSLQRYPLRYFVKPLDIPASLSGNFGELRPNHYHMGLDFKTNRVENLPVRAAADGYVARVKIEPFGFGRAIYINHPNGLTTVYAHLNAFFPRLEAYVKNQQYKLESWNVYLDIPANLFPVKQSETIAYSGNTGGSQGPHLHFEIRNTASDINLNPILFGFPIADQVSPVIQRLAIYDRNRGIYEQSPKMISVKKTANGYTTEPKVIKVSSDKISFAISGYDAQSSAPNHNGIFEGLLHYEGAEVIRFTMDSISYNATRYLNAHIDYKTKANGGPYLQHLSVLPGYINSIYSNAAGNGIIHLKKDRIQHLQIAVKDAAGNTATLNFSIQFTPTGNKPASLPSTKMFYPFMINVGEGSSDCEFYIGEMGLYDSARIGYVRTVSTLPVVVSAVHTIGEPFIPLQEGLVVRIKPNADFNADKRNSVLVQRFAGTKKEVKKAEWQNGWAVARFNSFGSFQLVLDETAPEIIPIGFKDGQDLSQASRLLFTVKDDLGAIKNFRAELDGQWLRFTNDKGRNFIYQFDEKCSPGPHRLKISVEDEAGNTSTQNYTFIR